MSGSESNIGGLLAQSARQMQQNSNGQMPARTTVQTSAPVKAVNTGVAILKQQMVNQLPKKDVFAVVLMSIAKAFIDTGTKEISEADRNYLVNELTGNIIKRYPAIRLNEIPEAIWQGVRIRFGEYYGMSLVTFERFIEQYLLSDKRTGLVKALPCDDAPKPAPDLQIQFETATENALRALQRKRDKKDVSAMSTSVYNFLDSIKLLSFTIREKNDMMADATRELIEELKYKQLLVPYIERAAIKKDIEAYRDAITEHTPVTAEQLTLVKMRAKKLALDAFLNNIILEGDDLGGLIDGRRDVFLQD
ncbi:hypothetical protein [Mucilaginibacter sp.]|uniref:hypothetical protein n=1 Tax=Mucilaginibacter sp. TaxID=1882438 RepID=UPI0025F42882|nr:hypothetical protein [Mucilaginibacter sp.]